VETRRKLMATGCDNPARTRSVSAPIMNSPHSHEPATLTARLGCEGPCPSHAVAGLAEDVRSRSSLHRDEDLLCSSVCQTSTSVLSGRNDCADSSHRRRLPRVADQPAPDVVLELGTIPAAAPLPSSAQEASDDAGSAPRHPPSAEDAPMNGEYPAPQAAQVMEPHVVVTMPEEVPPVECVVCRATLQDGTPVVSLECSHCFHTACIVPWFRMSERCPVCRTPASAFARILLGHDGPAVSVVEVDVDADNAHPADDAEPAGVAPGPVGGPDATDGWGLPVPFLNNGTAVGHLRIVSDFLNIRVPVRPSWVGLKWCIILITISLLCCGGFGLASVVLSAVLAVVLRPACRRLVALWRRSAFRERHLASPHVPTSALLSDSQMDELFQEHYREPVVETNLPPVPSMVVFLDSCIQRTSVFLGLTDQVLTGHLVTRGTYLVPATRNDFRPTNYSGTSASPSVVEVCVSWLDNVHDSTSSLVFWSPEMANQLMTSSRYIPAQQRATELGPRSSRITDQMLQSSYYSEVQAGSARVAMIRSSSADIVDAQARSTVLDFRSGSPSTPFMASDIVPKMGAPFLLLVGTMLQSGFVRTFIAMLLELLFRLV